ncbi:MAG: ELKS/Rab6-interacting/CAST family protein, partial [Candidatus Omnitrophica bacterium]|nr:ELKS/Rab6-interacting/CAST family protein [Candidatus Omnitrophota bacterium]
MANIERNLDQLNVIKLTIRDLEKACLQKFSSADEKEKIFLLSNERDQLKNEKSINVALIDKLKAENSSLHNELQKVQKSVVEISVVDKLKADNSSLQSELQNAQKSVAELSKQNNVLKCDVENITVIKASLASKDQKLAFLETEVAILTKARDFAEQQVAVKQHELDSLKLKFEEKSSFAGQDQWSMVSDQNKFSVLSDENDRMLLNDGVPDVDADWSTIVSKSGKSTGNSESRSPPQEPAPGKPQSNIDCGGRGPRMKKMNPVSSSGTGASQDNLKENVDVLIVGNSQTAKIDEDRIYKNRVCQVITLGERQKTLDGALDFLKNCPTSLNPKVTVIQASSNSLCSNGVDVCIAKCQLIIDTVRSRFPNSQICLGESLPRKPREMKQYIMDHKEFNRRLTSLQCHVIHHANLAVVDNILYQGDKIHLTATKGIPALIRNFKTVVNPLLGMPSYNDYSYNM